MRCHVGARASAIATTARGPSLYAVASHPFWVVEVGVFNTTDTEFVAALQRTSATGTQGAGLTEITADDDAYTPVTTSFNTHTADATVVAGEYARAMLGAAKGAGVIWTFGKNGIKVPGGTANGIAVTCPTGAGQAVRLLPHLGGVVGRRTRARSRSSILPSHPLLPPLPPPTGTEFGPISPLATGTFAQRRQAVIDAAVPQAVTNPGGTLITVNPSDAPNVKSIVTTGGAGARFWFTKGLYNLPVSGDTCINALAGQQFYFESAAGTSGNRTSANTAVMNANSAFGFMFNGSTDNLIKGGKWQGSAAFTPYSGCAIVASNRSTAEDIEVAGVYNRGIAVNYTGDNIADVQIMRRNYVHDTGHNGMNADEQRRRGTFIIQSNHVSGCMTRVSTGGDTDPGNAGGGTKFFTNNSLYDGNYFHDNMAWGLWNDWFHYNCTVTNNVIEFNRGAGIFFEACAGGNVFQHNAMKNNGNAAQAGFSTFGMGNIFFTNMDATVMNSGFDNDPLYPNNLVCDISYNDLDNYGDGPTQQPPAGEYLFYGPHPVNVICTTFDRGGTTRWTKGIKVHNNRFWVRGTGYTTGLFPQPTCNHVPLVQAHIDNIKSAWTDPTNEWYENEYHLATYPTETKGYWVWSDAGSTGPAYKNYGQWQSFLNHDTAYGGHAASTRQII